MSNEALTAVAKADVRPSGRKFVLMALADYADESWSCFPSVSQLTVYTSQGDKTVRDHLDALERDGILTRVRHRREDGTLGRYRFKIQRQNLPVAKIAGGEIHPVAKSARGENYRKPPADFAAHNPQLEPSLTSSLRSEVREPAKQNSSGQFEVFWSAYPNKVGKRDAERAFAKALQRSEFQAIMAGLQRYVQKTDDRPWCNPTTFLNQDRWEDQPAAPVPRQAATRQQPPTAPRNAGEYLRQKRLNQEAQSNASIEPNRHLDQGHGRAEGAISGFARRIAIPYEQ